MIPQIIAGLVRGAALRNCSIHTLSRPIDSHNVQRSFIPSPPTTKANLNLFSSFSLSSFPRTDNFQFGASQCNSSAASNLPPISSSILNFNNSKRYFSTQPLDIVDVSSSTSSSNPSWLSALLVGGLSFFALAAFSTSYAADDTTSIAGAPGSAPESRFWNKAKKNTPVDPEVEYFTNTSRLKGKYHYVIVGAGTAGFSALQTIRANDPEGNVLIIGEETSLPYPRPPLSKNLWRNTNLESAKSLKFHTSEQGSIQDLRYAPAPYFDVDGLDLVLGHRAVRLDILNRIVSLDDGTRIRYDKILLATGGTPKTIRAATIAPDSIQDRITTFRTVDDFHQLYDAVASAKSLLVIGGGALGSELAWEISHSPVSKNLKVIQAFPENGIFGHYLPRFLSDFATKLVRESGIVVRPCTFIKTIDHDVDSDKIVVIFDNNSSVKVDHVVLCVGIGPNQHLAKVGGLSVDDGIVVNRELMARSGVYAAGDCAKYDDPITHLTRVEHQEHAIMTGRLAGHNMSCDPQQRKPYDHLSMFWCTLAGDCRFEALGQIDSQFQTVSFWTESDGFDNPFSSGIIYYLNDIQQIVGIVFWNLPTDGKLEQGRKLIQQANRWFDKDRLRQQITFDRYSPPVKY